MASASGYNYHRFARALLKKSRKWEPSLSIQLYPTYWRFENSEINFLYDGPMKPFLLALRAQVIPAALIPFLYDIRPPVSFVDGCLVVEIQDHRKQPEVRSRIVMRPAPETLPLTIDIMLERRQESWDEAMTLELESRIMAATSAPLYLGTSPLAMRNAALSLALTAPANPNTGSDGAPRSAQAQGEEEDSEQETLRKLLATGTSAGRPFQPNWSVLRLMERIKAHNKAKEAEAAARAAGAANPASSSATGSAKDGEKKKTKKKRAAEEEKIEEEKKAPPKKKKKTAAAKEKEAREAKEKEEREAKEREEKEKAEKGKKKGKKKKAAEEEERRKKEEEEEEAKKKKEEKKKDKADKADDDKADKPKVKKKKAAAKEKEKEESEDEKQEEEKKKPAPKKKKKPAPKDDK